MASVNFSSIDKRSNLSHEEFMDEYGIPGKPVVLLDSAKDWRCLAEWDWNFFKDNYGSKAIVVQRTNNKSERKTTTWNSFIDYVIGYRRSELPFYLKNCTLEDRYPELKNYYTVPTYFENFLMQLPRGKRPIWNWLFIGPMGSGSPLHRDTHNSSGWLLVIKGKKKWTIFPPEDEEYLSSVPLEDIKTFKLDFEKHPSLSSTHPIQYMQSPGEIVYIPSRWYHQVLNLEPGIALTENFVNQSNRRAFKDYLLSNGKQQVFDDTVQHIPELNC